LDMADPLPQQPYPNVGSPPKTPARTPESPSIPQSGPPRVTAFARLRPEPGPHDILAFRVRPTGWPGSSCVPFTFPWQGSIQTLIDLQNPLLPLRSLTRFPRVTQSTQIVAPGRHLCSRPSPVGR
jgi:hypothetical protein